MRHFLRKLDIKATLRVGVVAALLFSVPLFIYIRQASYADSWLLYLGSFLFLITIALQAVRDTRARGEKESLLTLVLCSHVVTLAGVLIAVLIAALLLGFMVPGFFGGMAQKKQLIDEPAQLAVDKTGGLRFSVYLAATILNFSAGSFASIVFPFSAKLNQKGKDDERKQ